MSLVAKLLIAKDPLIKLYSKGANFMFHFLAFLQMKLTVNKEVNDLLK